MHKLAVLFAITILVPVQFRSASAEVPLASAIPEDVDTPRKVIEWFSQQPRAPIEGAAAPGEKSRELSLFPAIPENVTPKELADWVRSLRRIDGSPDAALQDEIVATTARAMGKRLGKSDFSGVDSFIQFLKEFDEHNGYAFYFCGEKIRSQKAFELKERLKAKDPGALAELDAARWESHYCFEGYLDHGRTLPKPQVRQEDPDMRECYSDASGYCSERTGWICHIMGMDYLRKAEATQSDEERALLCAMVDGYADCALDYFPRDDKHPGGYIQGVSTLKQKERVKAGCIAPTPAPKP